MHPIISGTHITPSARLALILGTQSQFKCPICLVPAGQLWDLSETIYPERSRNKTLMLIASANKEKSATAARKKLVTQSIRGIPVSNAVTVGVAPRH